MSGNIVVVCINKRVVCQVSVPGQKGDVCHARVTVPDPVLVRNTNNHDALFCFVFDTCVDLVCQSGQIGISNMIFRRVNKPADGFLFVQFPQRQAKDRWIPLGIVFVASGHLGVETVMRIFKESVGVG